MPRRRRPRAAKAGRSTKKAGNTRRIHFIRVAVLLTVSNSLLKSVNWVWLQDLVQGALEPQQLLAKTTTPRRPAYEVVTTHYGWTTPADTNFSRHVVTGEFFHAVLSHPQYNDSAWRDLEQHPDPTRRIIAFMDVDTCFEVNYPVYGIQDWWKNIETSHPARRGVKGFLGESCQYLHRAATSPALLANPESRLVLIDCSGMKLFYLKNVCKNDPSVFQNKQVIVAYTSAHKRLIRKNQDVGLPPPAIKPVNLTAAERTQIASCHQQRRYLFSFQGRGGAGREKLLAFDHHDDMYIRIRNQRSYHRDIQATATGDTMNYKGIMKESVFAGAPRGGNLFSYRFAEILSAGTVPVVYADGWVPPYHTNVINWNNCAVFIPESDYDKTGEILRAIPPAVRCQMQQCALKVWDRYAATRAGWVQGLVDTVLLAPSSHDDNRTTTLQTLVQ